jgi:rod shape-determining protein MreC
VLLLSAPGADGPGSRVVYRVLAPLQQLSAAAHRRVAGLWQGYVDLRNVRRQNGALKEEVANLSRERAAFVQAASENKRLRKLLDLKARHEFPSLVAQVVGEDAVGWHRTLFVDRGSEDSVAARMPVTVSEGIVGRVERTSAHMSQVLLVTDPNLSVDCRIVRTRDRGVLTGSLDRDCVLRYLNPKSEAKPGDEVFTSGLDSVFPRGLPVGRIESIRPGAQGLFLEAQVTPFADLPDIEEVIIILGHGGGYDVRPGLEAKP